MVFVAANVKYRAIPTPLSSQDIRSCRIFEIKRNGLIRALHPLLSAKCSRHGLITSSALSRPLRPTGRSAQCRASSTAMADADAAGAYLRTVARIEPPEELPALLRVLEAQGQTLVPAAPVPNAVPLAVPLAQSPAAGTTTALLRWPTPPEGLEMPVVALREDGSLALLAKSAREYVARAVVEDEAGRKVRADEGLDSLAASLAAQVDGAYLAMDEACVRWRARAAEAGGVRAAAGPSCAELLAGTALSSAVPTAAALDAFVTKHVGQFPDVMERLALRHLAKGDEVSALVTGEFYSARKHFPGFGSPFVFNALLLLRVRRSVEARDAARVALRSPWWTLSAPYEAVAGVAGFGAAQLEFARERLSEGGRQDDLRKGKAPAQVALDQAAFLMDVAAAEGQWDAELRRKLAALYEEAGVADVAAFLLAGL